MGTESASWLSWLEGSALTVYVRESTLLYPAIETAHILGFVILVGAAAMFDLRLLGFARTLPVKEAARHLLRWSRLSLLLVAPTGFTLFMTQATEMWVNPVFRVKLLLIALAGCNALAFRLLSYRTVERWNRETATPAGAKIAAVLSLALWTSVITCGRFIAYYRPIRPACGGVPGLPCRLAWCHSSRSPVDADYLIPILGTWRPDQAGVSSAK
jgi:hypothetical protein